MSPESCMSFKSEPYSPVASPALIGTNSNANNGGAFPPSPSGSDHSTDSGVSTGNNHNGITAVGSNGTTIVFLTAAQQQQLLKQQPGSSSPPSPPYSPPTSSTANILTNVKTSTRTGNGVIQIKKQAKATTVSPSSPVVLNQNGNIVTVSDLSNVKIPIPKVVKPGK